MLDNCLKYLIIVLLEPQQSKLGSGKLILAKYMGTAHNLIGLYCVHFWNNLDI